MMHAGYDTNVITQEKNVNQQTIKSEQEEDNFEVIYINNYSDDELSIADCINKDWNVVPLLDAITDKIGAPSYIRIYKKYEDQYDIIKK